MPERSLLLMAGGREETALALQEAGIRQERSSLGIEKIGKVRKAQGELL